MAYNIIEQTRDIPDGAKIWTTSVFRKYNKLESKNWDYIYGIKYQAEIMSIILPNWYFVIFYDNSFEVNNDEYDKFFFYIKEYLENKINNSIFIKIKYPQFAENNRGHTNLFSSILRYLIMDQKNFGNIELALIRNSRNPITYLDNRLTDKWINSDKMFMIYLSQSYGNKENTNTMFHKNKIFNITNRAYGGLFGFKKSIVSKILFQKILKFIEYPYFKNNQNKYKYGVDEYILSNSIRDLTKIKYKNIDWKTFFDIIKISEESDEIQRMNYPNFFFYFFKNKKIKFPTILNKFTINDLFTIPYIFIINKLNEFFKLEQIKTISFLKFFYSKKVFDIVFSISYCTYHIKNMSLKDICNKLENPRSRLLYYQKLTQREIIENIDREYSKFKFLKPWGIIDVMYIYFIIQKIYDISLDENNILLGQVTEGLSNKNEILYIRMFNNIYKYYNSNSINNKAKYQIYHNEIFKTLYQNEKNNINKYVFGPKRDFLLKQY